METISRNMCWNFIPARGTTGGILAGLKTAYLPIIGCQNFQIGVAVMIKNCVDNFVWRLVVIYGPAYEENKKEFIDELHCIMGVWDGPTMLGGDFNIVRNQREKSNGLINFNLVELFNGWIDRWAMIDLKDPARGFTWTNNQERPIMATLDRVLVTTHWDAKYPLFMTKILPRGVSDHNPVMITFGEKAGCGPMFRFEK
jgi:hypothetical protein